MRIRLALAAALLLAGTASGPAQTAPDPAPAPVQPAPVCKDDILAHYMAYMFALHGSTQTYGWNLDDMKLIPGYRAVIMNCGLAIAGGL